MAKRPAKKAKDKTAPAMVTRTGRVELMPLHDHLPTEKPEYVLGILRKQGIGKTVTLKRRLSKWGGLVAHRSLAHSMTPTVALPRGPGFTTVRVAPDSDDIVIHESWIASEREGLTHEGEAILAAIAMEVAGRRYRERKAKTL